MLCRHASTLVQAVLGATPALAKYGGAADRAWELVGQAQADLYFPDLFEGTWDVYTSLYDIQVCG